MFLLKNIKNLVKGVVSNYFIPGEIGSSEPIDSSISRQPQTTEKLVVKPQNKEEIDAQKRKEGLKATAEVAGQRRRILNGKINADPTMKDDPEAKPTIDLANKYRDEEERAKQALNGQNPSEPQQNQILEVTQQRIIKLVINNENNEWEISDTGELKVGDKITFVLDGIPEDINVLPTLTNLPEAIGGVIIDGNELTRKGIEGAFFNKQGIPSIELPTQAEISKIRSPEELQKLHDDVRKAVKEAKAANPDLDEKMATQALKKGLNIVDIVDKVLLSFLKILFDNGVDLSVATTGVETDGLGAGSQSFRPGEYKPNNLEENNAPGGTIDLVKFNEFLKNPTSTRWDYDKGSTQCSKTARLNLGKMGCSNVARELSAKASWESLGSPKNPFPPSNDGNIKACDIRVGSKSEFGHRACAFVKDGQWFVLDPYRNGKSEEPIPAQKYMAKNQVIGCYYYGIKSPSNNATKTSAETSEKATNVNIEKAKEYLPLAKETAQELGIEPEMILAIIQQESSFREEVGGADGKSLGLFQIRNDYADDLGYNNPQDMVKSPQEQFKAFVKFVNTLKGGPQGKLIQSMKSNPINFEGIASAYNGKEWESYNPSYAKKLENYYNAFKKASL